MTQILVKRLHTWPRYCKLLPVYLKSPIGARSSVEEKLLLASPAVCPARAGLWSRAGGHPTVPLATPAGSRLRAAHPGYAARVAHAFCSAV